MISQKIEDITFTGFKSISRYLRNLRGRLLSSEKFSEVFTLKPFPVMGTWVFKLCCRARHDTCALVAVVLKICLPCPSKPYIENPGE